MDKRKVDTTTPYIITEIKKIPLTDNSTVLDVGSGIGQYFPYFKGKITGIDFDDKNILRARKDFPESKLIKFDLTKGKIPTKQKFDLIICLEVIEHMSKEKALSLIAELEKNSKGYLLISTPNINNFTSLLRFFLFKKLAIAGKPNSLEKIIYFLKNKKLPSNKNKYFVMDEGDQFSNKNLHYHISSFNTRDFKKRGYRVIGGLGFIIDREIKNQFLKKCFNTFYYFFPYFSGSILGIKKLNE